MLTVAIEIMLFYLFFFFHCVNEFIFEYKNLCLLAVTMNELAPMRNYSCGASSQYVNLLRNQCTSIGCGSCANNDYTYSCVSSCRILHVWQSVLLLQRRIKT